MFRSFQRNVDFAQKGFSEYPLVFICMPYFFIVIYNHAFIALSIEKFGLFTVGIFFLPMVYVVWKEKVVLKHFTEPQKPKPSVLMFTEEQIARFEAILPAHELETLHHVLLSTLAVFKKIYTAYSDDHTPDFSNVFDRVLINLRDIIRTNALCKNTASRKRERAFLVSAFLSTVQHEYGQFRQSCSVQARLDENLLLKKLPFTLYSLLGSESYRLLGFESLIKEGQERPLNQDILGLIKSNDDSRQECQHTKNLVADDTLRKAFISWLSTQLSNPDNMFTLNQGGYVFFDPLNFSEDTVFITSSVFEHYEKIRGLPPQSLIALLSAADDFKAKTHNDIYTVFQIQPICFEQEVLTTAHIQEVLL